MTEGIYGAMCEGIVHAALDGYNGTVLCYGQTASGKTHTQIGTPADPGITILGLTDVFRLVELRQRGGTGTGTGTGNGAASTYTVTASYLEIYNERIYDMLAPVIETLYGLFCAPVRGSEANAAE